MSGSVRVHGAIGPRVLFVSSEAFPLAKTGGLGDVCSALPATLARLGADVRLMIPGYPQALDAALNKHVLAEFHDLVGENGCRLIGGTMPDSGLPVLLLEAPLLFGRTGGLYQDGEGRDWHDNHRRFAVFCHAAARVAAGDIAGWRPDVVHANDWHTGLLPALLRQDGTPLARSIFTIHNLAFQGNFPLQVFPDLGLPPEAGTPEGIEFYGQLSFMKSGIRYADRLTTVSPTYASEIMTPEHGCGLEGLLRSREADLTGILNGVDYDIWCPSKDAQLPQHYTADELAGKKTCKAALQQELGLPQAPDAPLLIFVNRLTHQKMADVVLEGLPAAVANGAQIVVHGEGERRFENSFCEMAAQFPLQMAARIGYTEALAHRLNAAGDISLTPSRFEPCGLTTMYAMRYGAVPLTRPVGGLADTVQDAGRTHGDYAQGTGFVFEKATAEDLASCMRRAMEWYGNADAWRPLQRRAMKRDFGWERSAQRYLALYRDLMPGVETEVDRLAG
jgi:starch synthase